MQYHVDIIDQDYAFHILKNWVRASAEICFLCALLCIPASNWKIFNSDIHCLFFRHKISNNCVAWGEYRREILFNSFICLWKDFKHSLVPIAKIVHWSSTNSSYTQRSFNPVIIWVICERSVNTAISPTFKGWRSQVKQLEADF
jgi:hypothetical protein